MMMLEKEIEKDEDASKKLNVWAELWGSMKKGLWLAYTWVIRYPLALIIAVFVVLIAALALLFLGDSARFNAGGILARLFGRSRANTLPPGADRVVQANKIPENRKDSEGNPIPIGTPDGEGYVQREVEVLENPNTLNPFRDKSVIRIKGSDPQETLTVQLPTGVIDVDVDKVIEVKPEVFEVVVKKRPGNRPPEVNLEDVDKYLG